MWYLSWDPRRDELTWGRRGGQSLGQPTAWHMQLLKAFNTVEDRMRYRTILPDEIGVLYRSSWGQMIWSFKPIVLSICEPVDMTDGVSGDTQRCEQMMAIQSHRICLFQTQETLNVQPCERDLPIRV
jgi:hypothetical protein